MHHGVIWWDVMATCDVMLWYQIEHYGITVQTWWYDIRYEDMIWRWYGAQLYHNVVGSGGLKEPRVRWGFRSAHAKEQFLVERTCPGMPDDTLWWAVQKWLKRLRCCLVSRLGWTKWSGIDAGLCQITLTTCCYHYGCCSLYTCSQMPETQSMMHKLENESWQQIKRNY